MTTYLIVTDAGIVTKPITVANNAALAAALTERVQNGKVAVIPLSLAADVASGVVPQAFLDGQTNQASLTTKAQNALTSNATYLAIGAPSVAQNTAQIQSLTKQCNGLIRLLIGQLDSTAGT